MKTIQGEVCLPPLRSIQSTREIHHAPFDVTFDHHVSISAYARIVWNRRWVAVPVAIGVFLVVLFGTIRQKPTFRATGTLEVEMPKQAVTGVTGLFQDQAASDNYLVTQSEILHSRAMAAQLMKKIAPVEATDAPHGDFGPASIDSVVHGLTVGVVRGSRLIEISDESNSPDTAAQVVNSLMSLYIEKSGQLRTESAQNASSWLLTQLNDTRSKLEQATSLLQRYEQRRGITAVVRSKLFRESGGFPTLPDVAAELDVHPRTLRRQLAAPARAARGHRAR